jgi:hypothetical protein
MPDLVTRIKAKATLILAWQGQPPSPATYGGLKGLEGAIPLANPLVRLAASSICLVWWPA